MATKGSSSFLYAGVEFECDSPSYVGRPKTLQGVVDEFRASDRMLLAKQGLQPSRSHQPLLLNGNVGPNSRWIGAVLFMMGCVFAFMPIHFLSKATWARMAAKRQAANSSD